MDLTKTRLMELLLNKKIVHYLKDLRVAIIGLSMISLHTIRHLLQLQIKHITVHIRSINPELEKLIPNFPSQDEYQLQ